MFIVCSSLLLSSINYVFMMSRKYKGLVLFQDQQPIQMLLDCCFKLYKPTQCGFTEVIPKSLRLHFTPPSIASAMVRRMHLFMAGFIA